MQQERGDYTQIDRATWLLQRRIGGSTCAKILGHSRYGGPPEAYDEVVAAMEGRHLPGDLEEHTPDQLRGHILEPIAATEYVRTTGRTVRRQPQRAHPEHELLTCNMDRQILVTEHSDELRVPLPLASTGVCELKVPRSTKARQIQVRGLDDEWIIQLQHNMGVTGYEWGSYGIMNPDEPSRIMVFDVLRDQTWLAEVWLPAMLRFITEHIEPRVRPTESSAAAELPEVPASELVVLEDPKWVGLVQRLRSAYEMAREIDALKQVRVAELKRALEEADASVVECSGVRIYYRWAKQGTYLDRPAVARYVAETGGDLAGLTKTRKASRPFKPYDISTGKPL